MQSIEHRDFFHHVNHFSAILESLAHRNMFFSLLKYYLTHEYFYFLSKAKSSWYMVLIKLHIDCCMAEVSYVVNNITTIFFKLF